MRKISIFLALLTASAFAQVPQPQINLTGNVGAQGFPVLNSGVVQFTSDANHTLTAQETSATGGIKVTSVVPLTTTRTLILPAGNFQFIAIENATAGDQSINVCSISGGDCVNIANGASATVWFDGTNVVQTGSSTGTAGGDLSGTYPDPTVAKIQGVPVSTATATSNQVMTYLSSTQLGAGGFLSALDLADCDTAYLYNEGSGTVTHNLCATGSAYNGVLVGSPAWSQYGLALNPQTSGEAVQLPTAASVDETFLIAGYFPYYGTALGVSWGTSDLEFPPFGALLCGTANNLMCIISNGQTGNLGTLVSYLQMYYPNSGSKSAAATSVPTGFHVIGVTCSLTNGVQYYLDGAPMPMAESNTDCPQTFTGNYQIGGGQTLWKSMMLMVSESFAGIETPAQMSTQSAALLGYIKAKGNVVTPTAAPSVGTPALTCLGDSRTVGVTGTSPCAQVTLDDTTATITTTANIGETASEYCFSPVYGAYPTIARNNGKSVAIMWIDVNDIDFGTSVPQIVAYDACLIKNFAAHHIPVLLATEVSSSIVANGDADKNLIDPQIMQYAKQWGATGVVNLASAPVLGADGASTNNTYFAGGLHPTTAGNIIIGSIYSNNVNELWGSSALNYNTDSGSTYTELAKDGYLKLTGTAAQTVTLPDCQGYSNPRTIYNLSGFTATVNTSDSGYGASFTQTIDGNSSTTIPSGFTAVYGIVPGPWSTGGCSWQTISTQATTTNASLLTSGTLADGRLSSNVAKYSNLNNNFAGNLTSISPNLATSSTNYPSPNTEVCGSIWNGTAATEDCWNWEDIVGTGTNPTSELQLYHTGSTNVPTIIIPYTIQNVTTGTLSANTVITAFLSTNAITNSVGLQVATASGCTISGGTIGSNCAVPVTLPVAEPDTSYRVAGCSFVGAAGPVVAGDIGSVTTTTFNVWEISMASSATGGGTINCTVTHN